MGNRRCAEFEFRRNVADQACSFFMCLDRGLLVFKDFEVHLQTVLIGESLHLADKLLEIKRLR